VADASGTYRPHDRETVSIVRLHWGRHKKCARDSFPGRYVIWQAHSSRRLANRIVTATAVLNLPLGGLSFKDGSVGFPGSRALSLLTTFRLTVLPAHPFHTLLHEPGHHAEGGNGICPPPAGYGISDKP
jgi:hypothetical protein